MFAVDLNICPRYYFQLNDLIGRKELRQLHGNLIVNTSELFVTTWHFREISL